MITGNELVRAVRGPILLITIGTLFALDHFTRTVLTRHGR